MQFRKFVPILVILAILLAACGQARRTSGTAVNEMSGKEDMPQPAMATHTPEVMMEQATEMMDTPTPDSMMTKSSEMMDTATPDTMMSHSDDMMDTPTPDAMMGETHAMTDTVTPEAMPGHSDDMMETATPDAMMEHSEDMMGTPTAEMHDSSMMAPAWFSTMLTNVSDQKAFTINDYQGKVILVEPMAQWCPTCLAQQKQVARLHEMLGENSDLVSLSLDIDPNEDSAGLQSYVSKNGFSWVFAVAPAEVSREIGNLYGSQFLNPPSAPMFIIDRHGEVHTLPFGIKSAEDLQKAIEPYLNE